MSTASSPTSAASPKVLAPSSSYVVNKPLASNGAMQTPSIFTNKEWIVPPRPKPGRKPAADIPPTKRKAQNRAAQRAFRERRAARVGELEEQMKKMEEEDQKEQEELRAYIHQLETDIEICNNTLLSWREKNQQLESSLAEEKRRRENAEAEASVFRHGRTNSTDAVPLPPRRTSAHRPASPVKSQKQLPASSEYDSPPVDCGNCDENSRCECLEQALNMSSFTANTSDPHVKRPHSPPSVTDNKRTCPDPPVETEIDFTSQFSSKGQSNLSTAPSPASISTTANPDPCGFCQDGTPCICAEMALEATKTISYPREQSFNSKTLLNNNAPVNPCINGPGTCAKCLSDPNSTLFCKSLAATREGYRVAKSSTLPTSATHGSKSSSAAPTPSYGGNNSNSNQAITGITLSCADAYETLSRHPAFEQASQELSTWMPKLATVPGGAQRTAFEVEAASVMGVLKFFDRRFGSQQRRGSGQGEYEDCY
ncbi:MAG: hypothetical protein LQ351_004277 [Letrouitia transgressa]|nr:MAG: hypothetical protein LQ351_004277 [Letrouitia transgressa]